MHSLNADTKAIVIKKNKVSGADVVLTIYSRDYGKKKLYVRGARHSKSRFLASCELLVEGDFSLYLKPSLSSLNSVYIRNTHKKIKEDLNKFFLASFMLELIDKVSEESLADSNLYDFFSFALKCLEAEKTEMLKFFRIVFLIKLFQKTGFSPEVNCCTSCLKEENLFFFSPKSGGAICSSCENKFNDLKSLKEGNISFINLALSDNYINVRRKATFNYDLDELGTILNDFSLAHIFSKELKTYSMIKDIGL